MNEKRAWDIAKLAVIGLLGLFEYETRTAINTVEVRLLAVEQIMMQKGAR